MLEELNMAVLARERRKKLSWDRLGGDRVVTPQPLQLQVNLSPCWGRGALRFHPEMICVSEHLLGAIFLFKKPTRKRTAPDASACLQQVGLLHWATAQGCPQWGDFGPPGGLFLILSHTAPDLSCSVRQEGSNY